MKSKQKTLSKIKKINNKNQKPTLNTQINKIKYKLFRNQKPFSKYAFALYCKNCIQYYNRY